MFFHEYEPEEIFTAMKTAGLDSLEFWMESPGFWFRGAHVEELHDLQRKFPDFFPFSMHVPVYDMNPCSINPRVREATTLYTLECMEMLAETGGGVLTIHPGKRTTKRPVTSYDRMRLEEYLNRIEKALPANVTPAIENMPPAINAHMVYPSELATVLDEYSWLSFTFDYAHALAAGGDALSFIDECGKRLVNVHASYAGGNKMHAPLSGTKEGEALREKLAEIRYKGLVTFELEDMNFSPLSFADKISILKSEGDYFASLRYI